MQQPDVPDTSAQMQQLLRILPLVFMGSTLLLAAVVEVLIATQPWFSGFVSGLPVVPLRYGLLAMALVIAIAALWLGRTDKPLPGTLPASVAPADPAGLRRAFGLTVVRYALLDGIAMLGLVLFLITGQRGDFYLFAVPALVLMLYLYKAQP